MIYPSVRHYREDFKMAYVRKKKVKGGEYYQLVQSRRVNGNPRQMVLLHLGRYPTVDAALKEWPSEIKRLRRLADKKRRDVQAFRAPVDSDEQPSWYRNIINQADNLSKEAEDLEAKHGRLREFRDQGVE
jgi:hypothetical protein